MSDVQRPPRGLRAAGKALWSAVVEAFVLDGPELIVLRAACEAADRAAEAKATVDREGAIVEGRFGPRAHPAVAVERDSRTQMLRALRELGYEPSSSTKQTAAARAARWKA